MQEASTKNNTHLIYGILFTAIALVALIALIVVRSGAVGPETNTTTQNASVSQSAPTMTVFTSTTTGVGSTTDSGGSGSTGIVLAESTTTPIYIHGTATDINGCSQIDPTVATPVAVTWTAKVYQTSATADAGTGTTCTTADNNDCYNLTESNLVVAGCTGGTDTTTDYEFTLTTQYFANFTDTGTDTWTARVDIVDSDGLTNTGGTTDLFEIANNISLAVGSTLGYGTRTAGTNGDSATETTFQITASGNRAIDLDASGSGAMTCTGTQVTTIPVSNAKYGLTTGLTFASMTAFSTVATNVDVSVPARTAEATTGPTVAAEGEKLMYFRLDVPTGVSGVCSNTVTLTSKVDV